MIQYCAENMRIAPVFGSGALGVSPQRMLMFRKYWAPDGLDAAIADLMPDDDNGKYKLHNTNNGSFPITVQETAHG